MNLRSVRKAFLDRLTLAGLSLNALTPETGVELMIRFYEEERVDRCPLDEDGDVLLFQWGTYDWGRGEKFEINISRQLMTAEVTGDEQIRQLSLTFRYSPESSLENAGDGDHWCDTPEGIEPFRAEIRAGPAFAAVQALPTAEVELIYEEV